MSKLSKFTEKLGCKKVCAACQAQWRCFNALPNRTKFGAIAIIVVVFFFLVLMLSMASHHSKRKTHAFAHSGVAAVSAVSHDTSKHDVLGKSGDRAALLHAVLSNQKAIGELSVELHMLDRHLGELQSQMAHKDHSIASIRMIKEDLGQSIKKLNTLNAEHFNEIAASINVLSVNVSKALKAHQAQSVAHVDPKALPFLVVDAEWWNGAHKIRIKDKKSGEYALIDVGTNYQGWVLSKVSGQAPTTFTFVNQRGQRVEVVR